MTDYSFHPDYVVPYYGLLMNANFVTEPKNIPVLFNGLKKIEKELDNVQLTDMLKSSWRPSKVAAWIIGLYEKVELEDELINTLVKDRIYCEHLIFSLAFLNTENSIASIEKHIHLETDSLRENFDLNRIERVSFDWAIAAIGWLDKLNKTTRMEKTLHVWYTFKKDIEGYEKKYRLKIDTLIHLDERITVFDKAMSLAKMYK